MEKDRDYQIKFGKISGMHSNSKGLGMRNNFGVNIGKGKLLIFQFKGGVGIDTTLPLATGRNKILF